MSPTLSLPRIATRLPFTYTGADFYALCSDAMLKAVTRQASAVDAQVKAINSQRAPDDTITTAYFFDHYAKPADVAVVVTEEDFMAAQQELIPSVSAKELEHYTKVRAQFEAVPEANGGADGKKANGVVEKKLVNGRPRSSGKGKGKGKARMEEDTDEGVAVGGFGRAEEDEDLY